MLNQKVPTAINISSSYPKRGIEAYHNSRCIRIGHSLLRGHSEAVAAEMNSIQSSVRPLPLFFQFRFVHRSHEQEKSYTKSFISKMRDMKKNVQTIDKEILCNTLHAMGRIINELLQDEGHVHKDNSHVLKMTISLMELNSRA